LIEKLDRYRKKRSVSIYDVAGAISDAEAKSMLAMAEDLFEHVHTWLLENHPALMNPGK